MSHKARMQGHLNAMAAELLDYIKAAELGYVDGWVPATKIKSDLDLNKAAVPRENKQYGETGWLFAILARMLEDDGAVDYEMRGSRAFYKSKAE